ncbi:MAG TPA: OmpH family outer membrane protein [Candidatus Coprenecus stercoripullorum]|nr:OmpH family outer membrane protein [Candidatus Coprenecus stercoripullorum]
MRKAIMICMASFLAMGAMSAQELKFGHINLQEVIFLMEETDSARAVVERLNRDMQETYNAMVEELNSKYATYQQMAADWPPATLEAKQSDIQSLEQRIQQFQQTANESLNRKQQELFGPITVKANEAVAKVGKANGLVYIFDLSAGAVPYVNEAISMNVTDMVKGELNIPLDKQLPAMQQQ